MDYLDQLMQVLKNNISVVTVVVTVCLAFFGYMITYIMARNLARKKDKLELVNRRLNEFYGPLYVATQAGRISYEALLKRLGRTVTVFPPDREPTQAEQEEWFLWMKTVFTPLNDLREKLIIEKAHLIVEEKMPDSLLRLVTHVVGYKPVLEKWEKGDFSEKFSFIAFPEELEEYVTNSYAALKKEQADLLNRI